MENVEGDDEEPLRMTTLTDDTERKYTNPSNINIIMKELPRDGTQTVAKCI